MTCSLNDIVADVLALLGEAPAPSAAGADIFPGSGPEEAISRKVAALLPGIGSTIIADADIPHIADAPAICLNAAKRLMPSGEYAAIASLPAGFMRPVAARLECWERDARRIFNAGSPMTPRLWSPEPGIAGSSASPLAYILAGPEGLQIYAMASGSDAEEALSLRCWCIPAPNAEGSFLFPQVLYNTLVSRIATQIA